MTEVRRMASERPSEREVLRSSIDELRRRLPPRWALEETFDAGSARLRADAMLRLTSPDGASAVFIVEAKTVMEPRDIAIIRDQLESLTQAIPNSAGMVAARYLAKSVRERLTEAGLSYADMSGNLRVFADRPALYLSDRGADQDPWRGPGRPRGTLKGEPAAKVVRALLDKARTWKVTDLIQYSKASTGSVYRVVEYLESEALTVRDIDGRVALPDWTKLLRRWSEDYQFVRTNTVSRWIAPRGLDHLVDQIRKGSQDAYAVTGTIAAAEYAPHAPTRSAMIYVADAKRAAQTWDLRAADSGVNVLLAEPAYPFVLDRTGMSRTGIRIVKPTQIAVDLLTGPGRSPSEAEELMDWMRANEHSWRI